MRCFFLRIYIVLIILSIENFIYCDNQSFKFDDQISIIEKKIKEHPYDVTLYKKLSDILWEAGKQVEAIDIINKALEINPRDASLYFNRAYLNFMAGKVDDAINDYKSAINIEPRMEAGYIGLGTSYYRKGEYENAITIFEKALEIDNTSTIALNGLGKSYLALGKHQEAREYFAKVIQWADPNGNIKKQAQEELEKLNALQPKPTGPTLDYKGYKFSEEEVMEVSLTWLTLLDNGQYTESWQTAAEYFKNTISKEQWEQSLTAVRTPLGKVISRNLKTKEYTKTLPGVPDGEYVVIQYETSFENKQSAVETVTPMIDKDGKWRVSGYYVR